MGNLSQAEIDAMLNNGVSGLDSTAAAGSSGEIDISQYGYNSDDEGTADSQAEFNSGGERNISSLCEELKRLDKSSAYLSDEEKDVLGEIGNICMGAAATTMYALLGYKVTITTPRVHVYTTDEVLSVYKSPFVVVKVDYRKGVEGKNLLILKERDSIVITDLLMGTESSLESGGGLDELHLSAMSEIMNQMIGSSATSLSNMLGIPIDITPPEAIWVEKETDISPFLDGSQLAVKVSFAMEIEGILKSEIMQVMSVETGKKLAQVLIDRNAAGTGKIRSTEKQGSDPAAKTMQKWEEAHSAERKEAPRTINVKPMKFEDFDMLAPDVTQPKTAAFDLIGDIPLQVSVELGKTKKSISDILNLGVGSVIVLDKMAGELVEVVVNGKRIARGEVVVIDENYGVRITDIISRDESA